MKSKRVKLAAATAGAGAMVAMGAFSVAFSETTVAEPPPPGPVTTTPITSGETITETVAPTEPETTIFEPPITATTPSGMIPP